MTGRSRKDIYTYKLWHEKSHPLNRLLMLSCLFALMLTGSICTVKAQDSIPEVFRKNIVKINFIPIIPALSGQSQQWVGLEYQNYINSKFSVSLLLNTGIFEDYSYIKYYDFFNQQQGFSYTQMDVITRGYHIIPSAKYYYFLMNQRPGQGLYVGGKVDFNQYFKKSEYFNSGTQEAGNVNYSIFRIGIGSGIGIQYIAFSRLSIDVDLSFFFRILDQSTGSDQLKTPPINAFWKTDDDAFWATVQLMIGYAFGGGNKARKEPVNLQ